MEIHKPKPVHNWREFLKEYAIIVLGVATALAAEQAAQALHDRARAADARAHIRAEIAGNMVTMSLRAASESCIGKRLDEVNGLIAASSDGKLSKTPIWIGRPQPWAMLDDRYKAATQSGAFSLFDSREQANYGALYTLSALYLQFELKEDEAWADLRMLEEHPPASPALDVKLRSALKQARMERWSLQRLTNDFRRVAAIAGFAPQPAGKLELQSTCLPLQTPRAEAQKAIIADRSDKSVYDEP